jgi:hypothetical protein
MDFYFDQTNGFTIILSSGGSPVAGETSSTVDVYATKNGGSVFSPSYNSFKEIDDTNMTGLYRVSFKPSIFDELGELVFNFTGSNFDDYRIRGNVIRPITYHLDNQTSDIEQDMNQREGNILSNLSEIRGSGFDKDKDSLKKQAEKIRDIEEKTKKILGLSDENIRITDYQYDDQGNATSAHISVYESSFDLENDGSKVAEYKMEAEYDSDNLLQDYLIKMI